ncbi:MAG: universal stress protein [Xenococcaceae cyanobacterium]
MSPLKKKSVLVPVDFSELSYQALASAKEYVEDISSLKVIHVLTPLKQEYIIVGDTTTDEEQRKDKFRVFLETKLSEIGYEGVQTEIRIGNTSSEIANYAQEIAADLIVMPSHGRTGANRFLIGSVAERVVRLSPCPVLILK